MYILITYIIITHKNESKITPYEEKMFFQDYFKIIVLDEFFNN